MMNKLPDKLTVKGNCNVNNMRQIESFAGKQAEGSISFHVLRNEE